MSKSRKSPAVVITGPASRLPSQRGEFGDPPPVEPISALPRAKPGDTIKPGPSVIVSAPRRTQLPRKGDY